MKKWGLFCLFLFLAACSDTNEAQQAVENVSVVNSETNGEKAEPDILASGYTAQEEVQMAIDAMYDWQSYHASYSFMYDIEGVENFNFIETEYVASSPKQKHSIIKMPYFEEEYYAVEDAGVFTYTDYTEVWNYNKNTDLALEDELIYSLSLLNKIVEVADEITVTQDIDSPNFASIIIKEDIDLFKEFRYYLSARTETIYEIMYANVVDVTDGYAYISYLDNDIVYYELQLNVIFEDFSTGVLMIKEEFDRINELEEIVVPDKVYAG